jgi:ABC-type enterochelin transport system permease subunit
MTEAECRLAEFWHETQAPARDLVFELGVEQRLARRRLLIDVAGLAAVAVAVAGLLAAFGPDLLAGAGLPVTAFDAVGPILAAVAAIGAAMVWLGRTPDEA